MRDEKAKKLHEQLLEELKQGQLSQEFVDQFRIADPATSRDQSALFQSYMEEITQRVMREDYDPQKHNFRFLISCDNRPNAGIIREAVPPVVILSAGLINTLKTEDQFAGVLAHELTHFMINSGGNSKFEESAADVWPVFALRRADYNPKALIETFDLISPEKEEIDLGTLEGALSYIDPHPKTPLRKRTMENALFVMARDEGVRDYNLPNRPANARVQQAAASVHHVSYMDRLTAQVGYNSFTPEQKLDFLINAIPREFGESLQFYRARISDTATLLAHLPREVHSPINRERLTHLVDNIMEFDDSENYSRDKEVLYSALSLSAYPRDVAYSCDDRPKLGNKLNELENALHDLIAASNPHDAEDAAKRIQASSNNFEFPGGSITWHMQWPNFRLPPEEQMHETWSRIDVATADADAAEEVRVQNRLGIAPSWQRHAEWGLQSPIIGKTLLALGIKDPRLVKAYKDELPPLSEWNTANKSFDELIISEGGQIIGNKESANKSIADDRYAEINADYYAKYSALEKRRLGKIDRKAQTLIDSGEINWELLERGNDFSAFISYYRDVLEPHVTCVEDSQVFAKVFLNKIEELLSKDPNKYKPIVREFFTATTYEVDHDNFFHRQGATNPQLATIPDIIKDQTDIRKFFGPSPGSLSGLWMDMGVSLQHPYVQFVLRDDHQLFSPADKLELLESVRFLEKTDPDKFKDVEFEFALDVRQVLGYQRPNTPQELMQVLDLLDSYQYKDPEKNGSNVVVLYQTKWEVCDYLEHHDEYLSLGVMKRIAEIGKETWPGPFVDRIKKALEAQVRRNAEHELGNGSTIEELAESYKVYAEKRLFANLPDVRREYDKVLSERLHELHDPQRAVELTENLLFNVRIDNPRLRKQVVRTWVDAQAELHGLDDKSTGYHQRMEGLMQHVFEKAKGFIAFDMLSELATGIQAQERLAYAIRDGLKESLKQAMTDARGQAAGIIGEFGLAALAKHDSIRLDTIEFLTSPLTRESAVKFYSELEKLLEKQREGRSTYFDFYRAMLDHLAFDASEEQKVSAIELAYENFWALPMEGRTFYLEKVLFPVGKESDESFRESANLIMDKLFPQGNKYADTGRLIINAYLDNIPVYGQRLLLSALMVAGEESGQARTDEDIGRALASVLMNLGPAGVKLAQAIHSYPDTPEDIRRGMDDVKGRADLPFRWDVFTRLEQTLPPEKRAEIDFVGPVVGGGSYQYTALTARQDGSKTALSLLRRNVRERAKTEFENFTGAAEALITDHPEFTPIRDIIRQAANMSVIETDYDKGKQQAEIASALYKGLNVAVGNRVFQFSTVAWLDHGRDYKEASFAEGIAFNDLPTETSQQKQAKYEVARAIVSAEMYMILTGKTFDHDRHGSNLHIDGNRIIGFDFGAMALEPPSMEEKVLLGKAFARAFKKSKHNGDSFGKALVSSIAEMRSQVHDSEYMASIQRGVLALGDYLKVMDEKDVQDIIGSVFKTGQIDRAIIYSTARELGYDALSAMHIDRAEDGRPAIKIHDRNSFVSKNLSEKPPSRNPVHWIVDSFVERALKRAGQQNGGNDERPPFH